MRKKKTGIGKEIPEERAFALGQYIVENHTTIRAAAKEFGIGKSTVHKDISQRLPSLHPALYASVKAVLDQNIAERHIRGGIATREKYLTWRKK